MSHPCQYAMPVATGVSRGEPSEKAWIPPQPSSTYPRSPSERRTMPRAMSHPDQYPWSVGPGGVG